MENMKLFNSNVTKTPAFGIDLGTTNSCISVLRDGVTPIIIPVDGNQVLPSCVMWEGGDNFKVGYEAYENRFKSNVAYSSKRLMGTDSKIELVYKGKKKEFSPVDIASKVLRKLADSAEEIYGKVEDVVITVPAYFNDKQVKDTIKAGALAGLNVLSIIREPTSASLILSEEGDLVNKNFLVYDLGGGTFDISLINISSNESNDTLDYYGFSNDSEGDSANGYNYRVVACDGDTKLGGDDVDNELLKIFLDKLEQQGVDTKYVPKDELEKIKLRMESCKKSGAALTKSKVKFKLCDKEGTKVDTEIVTYNNDVEKAYRIIYDRTKIIINKILSDSFDVDSIVLVGGSTKSEFLKKFLRRDFPGVRLYDLLNPDESVSMGAGYFANKVKFGDSGFKVFDVIPMGIGVLAGNQVDYIIPKNQSVPCSFFKLFKTSYDFQESVDIEVYQGDSKLKEMCTPLGTLSIKVPSAEAGKFPVKVKLECDFNGVLTCHSVVDEEENKLVLNSVTSGSSNINKVLSVKDKQIIRWTKLANTLDEFNKLHLLNLVEDFEKDIIDSSKVIDFVKHLKEK